MRFIVWIILGLIVGFTAGRLARRSTRTGMVVDILLGVAGALIGGWLFSALELHGATALNFYSMIVAVIAAVILVILYHALFRSSRIPRF